MSAVPTQVPGEPQGSPAVPAAPAPAVAPVGTTQEPQAVQDDPNQMLQQDLDAARADAERWKTEAEKRSGYEKVFTKSNQTGALELAKQMLPEGSSIEEAKAHVQAIEDAVKLQQDIAAMGGMDKIKENADAYELLYGEVNPAVAPTPGAPQAAPAAQSPEFVTRGELGKVVSEALATAEGVRSIATAKQNVAVAIARDAGLATDDKPVDAETLDMITGALDRAIAKQTLGARDPDVEDIAAAGQGVLSKLITPLRASGAVLPANQAQTPMPSAMNARGPGGQQPAKPVGEMTEEEQRARAQEVAQQTLEGLGAPAAPVAQTDHLHRFV